MVVMNSVKMTTLVDVLEGFSQEPCPARAPMQITRASENPKLESSFDDKLVLICMVFVRLRNNSTLAYTYKF